MPQDQASSAHVREAQVSSEESSYDDDHGEGGVDWGELEQRIRTQVVAHPFVAVGAAVATGYLVGRLFRR